jgi:hypothetical protein
MHVYMHVSGVLTRFPKSFNQDDMAREPYLLLIIKGIKWPKAFLYHA